MPTVAPNTSMQISDQEFGAIRKLVYDKFGIKLGEQKRTLVIGRLQKVLRQRGFTSFRDYLHWVTTEASGEGLEELANRISTNHTFFYRENSHFQYFSEVVLPEAVQRHRDKGDKDLRIWCAGCSSGEEPYTLMMLMKEHLGAEFATWKPLLLATDISQTALQTAIAGVYERDRVSQLPPVLKNKYFRKQSDGNLLVSDEIKQEIIFRRHNLMNATFPFKRKFDAIFCRNVMIYFDRETRNELVTKYHQHTVADGYLFIGHSETLGRNETPWDYVMPAVYRKKS